MASCPALTLTLNKIFAFQILSGEKQYEARRLKGKILSNLVPGNWVSFHWYRGERVTAQVEQVLRYGSVFEMLSDIEPDMLLPGQHLSFDEAVAFELQGLAPFCFAPCKLPPKLVSIYRTVYKISLIYTFCLLYTNAS